MNPPDPDRGTGRTTRQMVQAPKPCLFIWCNEALSYPRDIARDFPIDGIEIISPKALEIEMRWRGREYASVVVDHAASLTGRQLDALEGAKAQVRLSV